MEHYKRYSCLFLQKASFPIFSYILGYIHFSILWLILLIAFDIWKEEKLKTRNRKTEFYRNIIQHGEKSILEQFEDLPTWIRFPNMERAEWLNQIIKQIWPNVNNYICDTIKELLESKLNKKLKKYGLSGLTFKKLIIGDIPFRIGGINVYPNVSNDEIVVDFEIIYAGNCDVTIKFSKLKGNLSDFELYGTLRIIGKPLTNSIPLVGGLQAFFLNAPEINFNLKGLGGCLEFSEFYELVKKVISDIICSTIVLPNRYCIKLQKKIDKESIKIPKPRGVLRVHLIEARKLMKQSLSYTGQLTSDPYVILSIGEQEYKTEVKENTTKPKWDYWCEFIVEEVNGVYLFINVWNSNTLQEDESLGNAKIELSSIVSRQKADMWLNLKAVDHGELHMRATWLNLSTEKNDLKKILSEVQNLKVDTLNTAILTIFVNSASSIPTPTDHRGYYVEIKLGELEETTKTFRKPKDCKWEEGFTFLVNNPEDNEIIFKVIEEKEDKLIGELVYNIKQLLDEIDFKIEKRSFLLSQNESGATINLSLNLKILVNNSFEESNSSYSDYNNSTLVQSIEFGRPNLSEHSSLSRSSSTSSSDDTSSSLSSDILSLARIKLTLRYSVQRQRLIVVVHQVLDLYFDESKNLYVKLYILPERHKETKRKTEVILTGKDPVFDEKFEFLIPQEELSKKHLEVSVCEQKVLKNETLKKVVIDLDKLSLVLPYTKLFGLYEKAEED